MPRRTRAPRPRRSSVVLQLFSWEMPVEIRKQMRSEFREIGPGRVRGRYDGSDQPDQSSVGPMKAGGVDHQERLVRILIGDDPAATLVPVEDDLTIQSFLDDELIDFH